MEELKILDAKKEGIELLNQLETFVQIEGAPHYYISSEGRLANNYRKKKFYIHKQTMSVQGKVHWKIFYEDKIDETAIEADVAAEKFVAKAFLESVYGKNRIYHIDGDLSNNKYNNLIYVDDQEFYKLSVQQMHVNELGRVQAYVPFLNQNRMKAKRLWNDMQTRCYNAKFHKRSPEYEECSICQEWLEDKEKFFQWVEENYYTVGDERMDLDKDILVKGNKVYSPDTCVFVPHSINGLFTGCNKGRNKRKYPLGVYYDSSKKKYRANMNLDSENIKFSERNTPEEAFEDYKRHKEALILVTADKYKKYIPSKVYHAMLNWKVEITD